MVTHTVQNTLLYFIFSSLFFISILVLVPKDAFAQQGYTMCESPGGNRPHQVCGQGCPPGDSFISYNPNTPSECASHMQEGCKEIKNLHYDLGWNEGDKTKFCKKHGFDGMTNIPGTKEYKGPGSHGGGWCYKGNKGACTRSLPERGPD